VVLPVMASQIPRHCARDGRIVVDGQHYGLTRLRNGSGHRRSVCAREGPCGAGSRAPDFSLSDFGEGE
jgi:hypothetical protein